MADVMTKMVQYSVWPNCQNSCDFCLRKNRSTYSVDQQISLLKKIEKNISCIDWKNDFSSGISLLGGEIYNIENNRLQQQFLHLIDVIIEKILKVSNNKTCKYSTVTNGLYSPVFLYKVIDKIVNSVGISKVDINFSFDLKYRYKSEKQKSIVLDNINKFHQRYNYAVGVQMILTQYVIDMWKQHKFDVNDFIEKNIPGNVLCFLYPHPIATGKKLNDFNFKRHDFLMFMQYLKQKNALVYESFVQSTKNSSVFKYTGLLNRHQNSFKSFLLTLLTKKFSLSQHPVLSDGKEELSSICGHSTLYRCYSDTDKCMLCDLLATE